MTRTFTVWLFILCFIPVGTGALDVFTPVDKAVYHDKSIALIMTPNHPGTIVTLNGTAIKPFSRNPGYKSVAHGRLELKNGDNHLTVKSGKKIKEIHLKYSQYRKARKPGDQAGVFHRSDREKQCVTCHSLDINDATRSPEDKTKSICYVCHQVKFNQKNIHSALESFECLSCHQEKAGETITKFLTERSEAALCEDCHEIPTASEETPFLHGPLGAGQCTVCHDPHGSDLNNLLINDEPDLCLNCHSDVKSAMEKEGASVHDAIEGEGCMVCHGAHSGKYEFLLSKPVNDLCFDCHDSSIYVNLRHPVNKHPVQDVEDTLRPGKKLTCASCHNPHAGIGKKLMKAPGYMQLCQLCHKY